MTPTQKNMNRGSQSTAVRRVAGGDTPTGTGWTDAHRIAITPGRGRSNTIEHQLAGIAEDLGHTERSLRSNTDRLFGQS